MQTGRRAVPNRFQQLLRSLVVVLSCLGLATVSLAAASGTRASADPGAAVVAAAHAHLGDSYTWGATGPGTWDCSGFTSTLWREVGGVKDIPRTSRQQQAWAVPLPAEQVQAGDLVFFGDPVTHVGIVRSRVTTSDGVVVHMVDASSSQHGVVERDVWKAGTIRYGRVPRVDMTPVKPWTPPAAAPTTPVSTASVPPVEAVAHSTTSHALSNKPRLTGLPKAQRSPSSAVARKAAMLAEAALGNVTLTDVGLVRNVWRRAGGGRLPATRQELAAAGAAVATADLRVGDLIVYASPAGHVGIYVGNGDMIDASRALGKVVLRPVWSAPGMKLVRLHV